jgi:hypothetical protein
MARIARGQPIEDCQLRAASLFRSLSMQRFVAEQFCTELNRIALIDST